MPRPMPTMKVRPTTNAANQHNDTDTSAADDLIARVQSAAIIGDVIGIESSYQSGGRDMFETLDQDRIETAIAEAKARLKGGAK
jgi:hypothetical protein